MQLLPDTFVPQLPPRLTKLYKFIQEHPNLTEEEARLEYFKDSSRSKYFNVLKGELKKELLQYLIDTQKVSANKNKALIENCYNAYASCKIFFLDNKGDIAIEIAKGLIPKLKTLELHTLLYSLLGDLLMYYSVINNSTKWQKKYTVLQTETLKNINEHAIVMEQYNATFAMTNSRESFTPTIINNCINAERIVKPLIKKGRHNTNRYIYILLICRYTVVHDYESVVRYCEEALASFPKKHPNIRSLSFVFLFNKTSALIPLNKLDQAKRFARKTQSIVPRGNFNWYLALIKRTIVCFHAKDYQEAYQLYKVYHQYEKKVQKQKQHIPPVIQEYWKIIKGYIYLLIQVGLIKSYNKEHFYIGKFLNEVPIYSKDKAGNNINILIIQILIEMKRGQFIKIIDRIDSLREYARLYTRSEETKRANIFIKMLIKTEQAQFHKARTEMKAKALVEKLHQTPLCMNQNLAIEMIPYEVLWEEVLLMLENKFRALTAKKKRTKKI